MSKRIENECAWCAEEFDEERGVVGRDRKVYCSRSCAAKGEEFSEGEFARLLKEHGVRSRFEPPPAPLG
jgi:hypothetical protein